MGAPPPPASPDESERERALERFHILKPFVRVADSAMGSLKHSCALKITASTCALFSSNETTCPVPTPYRSGRCALRNERAASSPAEPTNPWWVVKAAAARESRSKRAA